MGNMIGKSGNPLEDLSGIVNNGPSSSGPARHPSMGIQTKFQVIVYEFNFLERKIIKKEVISSGKKFSSTFVYSDNQGNTHSKEIQYYNGIDKNGKNIPFVYQERLKPDLINDQGISLNLYLKGYYSSLGIYSNQLNRNLKD